MARLDRDGVLARTDLRALLDEFSGPATGTGAGARWRCPHPEHEDLHPSVSMTTTGRGEQRWRCWSGGHGGSAIDLIITTYRVDFAAAVAELARRAGVRPDEPGERLVRPPAPVREPVPLHRHVVRYVEICEQLLWKPAGRLVLDYLTDGRGLDHEVLRANRVGADPGLRMRRPRGLPKGGPGAVLPVLDPHGEIAYAQTRYLQAPEGRSKYDNPHRRLGDNPRHGWTRPAGEAVEPIVICEGLIDAYTINDAGYRAVALLGAMNATAALIEHIGRGIGDRPVVVALDADLAGLRAARVVTATLQARGMLVGELPLPSGTDLNSWARNARLGAGLGPAPLPTIPGP